jgi:hypothetical protein
VNLPLFLLNLALTVGLVCVSLWTGKRGVRKQHYGAVGVTVVSLVLAIWQAELYGRGFVFIAWKLNVHLFFAMSCLASVVPVAVSGWMLRTDPRKRANHKLWIRVFLGLLVGAVATACFMFLGAEPKN